MLAGFLNNLGAAYNLTAMGLVLLLISSTLPEDSEQQSLVASSGMAGAVTGQLVMGFLGLNIPLRKTCVI